MKNILFVFLGVSVLVAAPWGGAQAQVSSDTVGGVIQRELDKEKSLEFEERIRTKQPQPQDEEIQPKSTAEAGPSVLIKEIKVEGATLLSDHIIDDITTPYKGTELSLAQIQDIAEKLTAVYRTNGYVTSRAYIPPQNLQEGTLTIKVIEGKMGELTLKGNKYFSKAVYLKYLKLRPNEYFDYSQLQKDLTFVNEQEDRKLKATLVPGQEAGATDVILEAQEQLPIHATVEFDNWASRYLNHYRYALSLEHNNITGHDDRMLFKYQTSDGLNLKLYQGRYLYPLSKKTTVGVHGLYTTTHLGREFKSLGAEGKGQVYGMFMSHELARTNNAQWHFNLGYDYKDIKNDLLGIENSHDQLSIFKAGMDLDVADPWGRNILTGEGDFGVPEFLGAMEAKNDRHASRTGAGGQFQKGVFNYYRLQPMPLDTQILLKNSAQISNQALVSAEQFQIGGPTSVRGYAPGEFSGDKGLYSAVDWSVPLYFVPKHWKVPLRKETVYDAMRLVAFYDFGFTNIKNVTAGERENRTLKGYGFGARFNPDPNLEVRFEMGMPIGTASADGKRAHPWVQFKYKY